MGERGENRHAELVLYPNREKKHASTSSARLYLPGSPRSQIWTPKILDLICRAKPGK